MPAFATARVSSESLHRDSRINWPGLLIIASGALIALGSMLPWFSLFAGLQPYRGTSGLYGQLVLGSGIAAALVGLVLLRSENLTIRNLLIVSGAVLSAFMAWLMTGLFETYRKLLENPMYVARLEPGLFVALAGAVTLTLVAAYTRRRSRVPAESRTSVVGVPA